MNPVLKVGDKVSIEWPSETDEMIWYDCECIEVERQKKIKYGSFFKYKLCTIDNREVLRTRLLHMNWRRISGTALPVEMVPSKKRRLSLPAHRFICAPMVGASELAFRLLCRKYGVQLAYTPMINSELFATDAAYREQEFQTTPEDRPLVAHFSGNNPSVLVAAAKYIEKRCDAIDLNLGCPQRVAYAGHFGSFLLDEQDRDLVLSIVRALSENISLPIFVKIRLLDSVPDTIRLCRQLVEAGAALIAIHARYRVNLVARTGPGARDGPAHLDQVATIKKAVPGIPIIANGNVITWNDIVRNLEFTGADGIMSAEGLLDNPAIFAPSISQGDGRYYELEEVPSRSKLQLAMEYLYLAEKYPVKMKSVIFHVRRICKEEFNSYQLLEDCLQAKSIDEVLAVVKQGLEYEKLGNYEFDPEKAKKAKDAAAKKKFEEGKRKRFEERMVRKAKREGREDLNFYLNQGVEPPTIEDIAELKRMSEEGRFGIWKERFSQHCYGYHFGSTSCTRDRTCAFLHSDPSLGESLSFG